MGSGEFVWTGFDYLGEPTPYDESWPSSSYFGINDLAGLPLLFIQKPLEYERINPSYFATLELGRSWGKQLLFVYTSFNSAELL
jgi:beta-galactosidase